MQSLACKILLVFCLAAPSYEAKGQELETMKLQVAGLSAEQKLDQYLKIALLHIEKYGNPDSVLSYARKANDLSASLKQTGKGYRSSLYLAIGYQQKNKFDSSSVLLNTLIDKAKNQQDTLLPDVYYQAGITYYRSGDKKKALEFFLSAVKGYKDQNNNDGLALGYCKLADVLVTDSQNKEAGEYKDKAVALLPKLSRPYAKIFSHNLISRLYMDMRAVSPSYIDSSISYAKKAYALMKDFGYYTRAYQTLNIISDNYFIKDDYETGISYCRESLKYRSNLYPGELILAYVKFADYYDAKKNYAMALNYMDSVRLELPKINVQYYRLFYFERSYQINKKMGRLAEALSSIEHYNSIKDSLYNVNKSKEINELEQRYNRLENEKKINELNTEKEMAAVNSRFLLAGIIASVFAIIVIVFFYRQSIIKNKLKFIETEQRLNRARMDPHFFFNILSSLRAFTLKEKDTARTADYLTRYSKLMRQSLESSYSELVTLETELDFLQNYFEIQKLRYPEKFDHLMNIDNGIDVSELFIPSMIIQPFIENSIEHGFFEADYKGLITLNFEQINGTLKITVADNGLGKRTDTAPGKAFPSRATQIVSDRFFLLNKHYKTKARFEIIPNEPKGTKVIIYLPTIYTR